MQTKDNAGYDRRSQGRGQGGHCPALRASDSHVGAASCEISYVYVAPAEALSTVVGHPLAIVKTFPDTFQHGEQLFWPLRDIFHAGLLPDD